MYRFIALKVVDTDSVKSFQQKIGTTIEEIAEGLFYMKSSLPDRMIDENLGSAGLEYEILTAPKNHTRETAAVWAQQEKSRLFDASTSLETANAQINSGSAKSSLSVTLKNLEEKPPVRIKGHRDNIIELERFEENRQFDELVDIESIKQEADKLVAGILYAEIAEILGLKNRTAHKNILIAGPTGTGKTTMAKMIGLSLAQHLFPDYKPSGVLVEADFLIGEVVGETMNNVRSMLYACHNDVVVIDEIDKFLNTNYADEAFGTLVTHTGNHINSPLIIGTLYASNLETFLQFDKGIRGRFPNILTTKNYSDSTLQTIFKKNAGQLGYQCSPQIVDRAGLLIAQLRRQQGNSFGNAREIDNLWSKIIDNRAVEMQSMGLTPETVRGMSKAERLTLKEKMAFITLDEMPNFDSTKGGLVFYSSIPQLTAHLPTPRALRLVKGHENE